MMKVNFKLAVAILVSITALAVGTYSLYYQNLGENSVNITTKGLSIQYTKGTDVLNGTLDPSTEKTEAISTTITLWKTISEPVKGEIYLNIKEIGTGLAKPFLRWEIYNGTTQLAQGNFNEKVTGNSILMYTENALSTTSKTYKVYVWLDENLLNDTGISDQPLKLTVTAKGAQVIN